MNAKSKIENAQPVETGPMLSAELVKNGWEPRYYVGDVVTPRTRRSAMLYRDAKTKEFRVVAAA